MVAFHYGLNRVLHLVIRGMMKTEEDVKPISYVKANAMMKLIQLAKKDAENSPYLLIAAHKVDTLYHIAEDLGEITMLVTSQS